MTQKHAYSLQKRRYAQISVKKRLAIVRLVEVEGRTYSDAGRKLHINASTVRLIIKKYKLTGTIFMKRLRNAPKNQSDELMKSEQSEVLVKHQQPEMQQELPKQQNNVKVEHQGRKNRSLTEDWNPSSPEYYHRY